MRILLVAPKTRLYQRLLSEGRLLATTTGDNTEAFCNFAPKLDREYLTNGYRRLMKSLYEPKAFYSRARTFLAQYQQRGPQHQVDWTKIRAFGRSLWLLGIRHRGRYQYWRFLAYALAYHPRAFVPAVTLAIYGHHFRTIAERL